MGVTSWLLPPRMWRPLARVFAPLAIRVSDTRGGSPAQIEALIAARIPGQSAQSIQRESFTSFIEASLQHFRMYRPGGWNPKIELEGRHHLDEALARGAGAVLWLSWFQAYALVAKMALHQSGNAVSHLSHPRHGFGNSAFAIRCLNPLCTRVENRYLRERVTRSQDSALNALRALERRLRSNGVVSVTASGRAEQPTYVPFLAGRIPVAPGAPFLSYRTGAALLPVHAVQVAVNHFRIVIDPPLAMASETTRAKFIHQASEQYASSLAPWVIKYPEQWLGWQDQ